MHFLDDMTPCQDIVRCSYVENRVKLYKNSHDTPDEMEAFKEISPIKRQEKCESCKFKLVKHSEPVHGTAKGLFTYLGYKINSTRSSCNDHR